MNYNPGQTKLDNLCKMFREDVILEEPNNSHWSNNHFDHFGHDYQYNAYNQLQQAHFQPRQQPKCYSAFTSIANKLKGIKAWVWLNKHAVIVGSMVVVIAYMCNGFYNTAKTVYKL